MTSNVRPAHTWFLQISSDLLYFCDLGVILDSCCLWPSRSRRWNENTRLRSCCRRKHANSWACSLLEVPARNLCALICVTVIEKRHHHPTDGGHFSFGHLPKGAILVYARFGSGPWQLLCVFGYEENCSEKWPVLWLEDWQPWPAPTGKLALICEDHRASVAEYKPTR